MTDNEPKWDYTTKEGNFAAGAAVVGGNLLVLIIYILYRTVPSVHHFIIGRWLTSHQEKDFTDWRTEFSVSSVSWWLRPDESQ